MTKSADRRQPSLSSFCSVQGQGWQRRQGRQLRNSQEATGVELGKCARAKDQARITVSLKLTITIFKLLKLQLGNSKLNTVRVLVVPIK
jgi:hypothetical protein